MKMQRSRQTRRLTAAEWVLFGQLVVLSLTIHVALLIAPLERVAAALDRGARAPRLGRLPWLHRTLDSERLTTLADLATRLTSGKHRCLPRSLVLLWLMRARGETAELLVGAARTPDGDLEGHAWIEIRGRQVLDTPAMTRRYSQFLRL